MLRPLLVAPSLVLLVACAPVLSTMTPAPVAPRGHFRGEMGFGPKILYATYGTAMRAKLVGDDELATVSGSSFTYGLQVGGAIGYKYAWLAGEMTIAGLSGSADIDLDVAGVRLKPKFGGAVIYPAVGVMVQL